jgi:hypothetical protein
MTQPSVTLRLLLAGPLMLGMASSVQAQNSTLLNNSLLPNGTSFRTTSTVQTVECSPALCYSPIFYPGAVEVTCTTAASNTCILYIQIDAIVGTTLYTYGAFRFLVDGKPPNPGPTGASFGYAGLWSQLGAHSFAVVAQVTGGVHSVEVDFGCQPVLQENNTVTCTAYSYAATLKVDAYTP